MGSSKGGYAALYFGIKYGAKSIISGAPQYLLGNYLSIPEHKEILKYIMGDESEKSISELNSLMPKVIKQCRNNPDIYLHYSVKEHTYKEHIEFLINDLKKQKYNLYEDRHDYLNHSDVGVYFPKYILNIIKDIL